MDLTGTIVDSTATYSCNDGFTLEGQSTRTCQDDGEWSGSAPTCERKLDVANLCIHAVLSSTLWSYMQTVSLLLVVLGLGTLAFMKSKEVCHVISPTAG